MKELCEDCGKPFKTEREDCCLMCDTCYEEFQERVKFLSDRNNRMDLVRAATFYANNCTNSEEMRLRAFFGSVMPELPQSRVEKFLTDTGKRGT